MKLKWSAIVFGALIDIAISIALGLLLLIVYASILAGRGLSDTEIQLRLTNPLSSGALALLLVVAGAVTDGVAGYLTAKFAGYLEYWHTFFMILTVMFLHAGLSSESTVPLWYELAALGLGILAAFYGAGIVKRNRTRMS